MLKGQHYYLCRQMRKMRWCKMKTFVQNRPAKRQSWDSMGDRSIHLYVTNFPSLPPSSATHRYPLTPFRLWHPKPGYLRVWMPSSFHSALTPLLAPTLASLFFPLRPQHPTLASSPVLGLWLSTLGHPVWMPSSPYLGSNTPGHPSTQVPASLWPT